MECYYDHFNKTCTIFGEVMFYNSVAVIKKSLRNHATVALKHFKKMGLISKDYESLTISFYKTMMKKS